MPNHITNKLHFEGEVQDILEVRNYIKGDRDGQYIDFMKIATPPNYIFMGSVDHTLQEIFQSDKTSMSFMAETDLHCEGGFYIDKTRRAFIDKECIQFYHDYEADIYKLEILGFKQAWAASPENFIELSKQYELDIKIFTFEMGMEFTQEIEIINGELTKNKEQEKFDDYFWEVPFATIGG
ncbi:hypothetical protein [Enterococcus raffinosus]